MLFSVVVPLYNKRKYIRRCVDSVLEQTFSDFELIVVDDGSNDGSSQEIEMIIDNRLQIINKENGGVGSARNKGILASTSDWIAFLDADDAWYPDHLDELYNIIKRYPQAGMISTKAVETSESTLHAIEQRKEHSSIRIIDYFFEASKNISVINSSNVAISRDVCKKVGGFLHYKAGEDLEYWARIAMKYPVAVSDRLTSLYFRDTGGVMQQIHSEHNKVTSISSIRDFSPSLATICEAAEKNPDIWKNYSIKTYVNSRIKNAIKGALYRGDFVAARGSAHLFLRPLDKRFSLWGLLKYAPVSVLRSMVFFYKSFR